MDSLASSGRSVAPIFVVGTPRSGTTLLAAMLGAHPAIDCGPETRFFSWLEREDRLALLDPRRWPDRAVDFVVSLKLRDAPVHELFGVSPAGVREALEARSPSVAAMLESLTATRAAAHGKPRWAEKTPRHIEALPLIRREWRDAVVIRVVRDPRDVALSLTRVPFGSPSPVINLVKVATQEREAAALVARDTGTLTVRFEDLVAAPAAVLARVCEAVGVPFDPVMIERPVADGIAAPHEWWKQKAGQPLDPSRAGAWRETMAPDVARFAALHCRDVLRAHGYPGAADPRRTVAIVPLGDGVAVKHPNLLLALAQQDAAVMEPVPRTPDELGRPDELVFWGVPGQLGLRLGRSAFERTVAIARLSKVLAARRASGRGALWVRRHTAWPERPEDPTEAAAARLLQGLARTIRPRELPAELGIAGDVMGGGDEDAGDRTGPEDGDDRPAPGPGDRPPGSAAPPPLGSTDG